MPYTISDLRTCPQFRDDVVDRVWREWWQPKRMSRTHVAHRVDQAMNVKPVPLALVAHDDALFLGTASIILTDVAERKHLSPWVAAVWVDPDARNQGVGAALVDVAALAAFDAGFNIVYLGAYPDRLSFYEKCGWRILERNIGPTGLSVLTRALYDNL